MSKLWRITLGAGLCVVLAAVTPFSVTAQGDKKAKDPEWKHGMNLRVRKAGEKDFTKEIKKYGLEVFSDENSGHLIYISEFGSIALVKGDGKGDDSKAPNWRHAMDLKVRKAGEAKFGPETKKYGVEVFSDENNGDLIYMCETGSIAVVPGGASAAPGGASKAPDWKRGMEMSVRKAGEKDFNKETKKYGVEVFSDENNGNLVYISETGSIAVATGVKTDGDTVAAWKYGFEVKARKAGEGEFSKETKGYNVEVFQDVNNGNVIYISETGALAVLPGVKVPDSDKVKTPEWKYASDLAARKSTEDKFSKETKKYGVEFFRDENDGVMVAISEVGDLAVMLSK
jgi:hypothetical protein